MNCTWRTWTSRVWKNLLFPGFSRVSMGPSTCFLNGFSKKMIWCTWGWAQEANVSYASNMFSNFLGTLSKNSEVFKTKWSNSEEFNRCAFIATDWWIFYTTGARCPTSLQGGESGYGSCLLLRFIELFLDLYQYVFFIQSHGFLRDLLAGNIIPIRNPLMVTTWMSQEVSKLLVNGL